MERASDRGRVVRRRLAVVALALAAAVGGATALADVHPGAAAPVFCGADAGRYVALTFDDGPGPATPRVLRALSRYRARATFFVVGRHVAGRGSLVRREAALGEVGNHSWSHPDLSRSSSSEVRSQLAATQRAIRRAGAPAPTVFRPPYGRHDATVDAEAYSLHLREIASSVDSFDWRGASTARIARRVLGLVRPGSVVLMHDVIPRTAAALPRVLRGLRARGYDLVTVSELLERAPPSRAQLGRGRHGCDGG